MTRVVFSNTNSVCRCVSLCVVKQRDDVIAFSSPSVNKRSHREAIPGRRRHAGSEHFDVLEVGSILFILSHFLVSVKVFFFCSRRSPMDRCTYCGLPVRFGRSETFEGFEAKIKKLFEKKKKSDSRFYSNHIKYSYTVSTNTTTTL